jgi:hypothetical protein
LRELLGDLEKPGHLDDRDQCCPGRQSRLASCVAPVRGCAIPNRRMGRK